MPVQREIPEHARVAKPQLNTLSTHVMPDQAKAIHIMVQTASPLSCMLFFCPACHVLRAAGLQFNRPRKGRRDTEIRRRLPELHRAQPYDSGANYTAHNRNTKEEARAAKNAFFRIIADDATHHCIMRPRFVMYEIS